MTNTSEASYPDRDPIDPRAFAVRHILLQELARRVKSSEGPLKILLQQIADQLSIERVSRLRQYFIYINGQFAAGLPFESMHLFSSLSESPQQDTQTNYDSTLSRNHEAARVTVEILVNQVQSTNIKLHVSAKDKDSSPSKLSCILPVYNQETDIRASVEVLNAVLASEARSGDHIIDYEIILANYGSAEQIKALLTELQIEYEKVKCINFPSTEGYGSASYQGFLSSRYDLVFFSDSDSAFDYKQITRLLALIRHADVVCGYREQQASGMTRMISAWGWRVLVRILFGRQVRDIDCAFKLFRSDVLKNIGLYEVRGKEAIINTEILVRLRRARATIIEAPVAYSVKTTETATGYHPLVFLRAFKELIKLFCRIKVECLGYLGFIFGIFSRTNKPLELLEFRHSSLVEEDNLTCRVCQANHFYLRKTDLFDWDGKIYPGRFNLILCKKCKNAFTHPGEAETFTGSTQHSFRSAFERRIALWFINRRVARIEKARKGAGHSLLDIGVCNSLFTDRIIKAGLNVTVLQPSHKEHISEKMIYCPEDKFHALIDSGVLKENSFDIVTMWHSLELFEDLNSVLQLANKLLKKGGLFYICVPNLNSMQAELGGRYWAYLDMPNQKFHFTLDGLIAPLRSSGFEYFKINWFSWEYEIFGFMQTFLNIISRSHNYFYAIRKKAQKIATPYPRWTRVSNLFIPFLLPLSFFMGVAASLLSKPSCAEISCYKQDN